MRRYLRGILGPVLVLLASAACAAGTAGSSPRTDRNRISHEEIESVQARNAFEVVQQLRPRWLTQRGSRSLQMSTEIAVFLNGNRLEGIGAMRQVETDAISEIEYLDASQATAMLPGLGSEHVSGAIVIRTSPRP